MSAAPVKMVSGATKPRFSRERSAATPFLLLVLSRLIRLTTPLYGWLSMSLSIAASWGVGDPESPYGPGCFSGVVGGGLSTETFG